MSSNKEFSFSRPLSIYDIFSRSIQYYLSNFYIYVFYFIAFLIFLAYIFSVTNLGYPSTINNNFESVFSNTDFTNPDIEFNELLAIYRDILFVLVGEGVVIGVLLAIPYALTVTIVDISIKNNFTKNLPLNQSLRESQEKISPLEKMSTSFKKMFPKFFIILVIAFILNLLIEIGNIFFFIPGILLSVYFALVPVLIILEPQVSFGSLFSRSKNLISGSFFKVLGLLLLVFVFQYFSTSILESVLGVIYFSIQGIDPNSFTDPGFIIIHYISESLTAPLTIIVTVILYHDLKFVKSQFVEQRYNYPYSRPIPQQPFQIPQQTIPQPKMQENNLFCIYCGKPNPNYASFCAFCGKNLQKKLIKEIQQTGKKTTEVQENKKICRNCGKPPLKLEDSFCQYCGHKYD